MQRPYFAAAREVASSPSGCASFIDAAGLKPNGSETCLIVGVGTGVFVSVEVEYNIPCCRGFRWLCRFYRR